MKLVTELDVNLVTRRRYATNVLLIRPEKHQITPSNGLTSDDPFALGVIWIKVGITGRVKFLKLFVANSEVIAGMGWVDYWADHRFKPGLVRGVEHHRRGTTRGASSRGRQFRLLGGEGDGEVARARTCRAALTTRVQHRTWLKSGAGQCSWCKGVSRGGDGGVGGQCRRMCDELFGVNKYCTE